MMIAAHWTLPRHCKWVPEALRLLKSARGGSTSQLTYETRHPAFLISSQSDRIIAQHRQRLVSARDCLCGGQQAGEMLVLAKGSVMNLAATFLWRSCTTRTRNEQVLHRGA